MKWHFCCMVFGLAASVGCIELGRALDGETAEVRREPDWGPVDLNENEEEQDGDQSGDEQLDDAEDEDAASDEDAEDTNDPDTDDEGQGETQGETQDDLGPQPPDETADETTEDDQDEPETEGGPSEPPQLSVDLEEITSETGLRIIDIKVGSGAEPETGDRVQTHYTGWLEADGTKFDSSFDRGQPFTFALGTGGVIQGWDEGFATMQPGGKRRLIIPPDLAYGPGGNPPTIPADATLIFDVELISINP